jgi:hypothetical protein
MSGPHPLVPGDPAAGYRGVRVLDAAMCEDVPAARAVFTPIAGHPKMPGIIVGMDQKASYVRDEDWDGVRKI